MESPVDISTVNNDENSGDNDDSNNLNNIFDNITNRSAEELQRNSIFQLPADLVTFTEEIFDEKLHLLRSELRGIVNIMCQTFERVSQWCFRLLKNVSEIAGFSSSFRFYIHRPKVFI